jgi:hypothetical protein
VLLGPVAADQLWQHGPSHAQGRLRTRVPRNYSLFLEHSSEALRDGFSLSGSDSDDVLPWPEDVSDSDATGSSFSALAGDGREACAVEDPLHRRAPSATRHRLRSLRQPADGIARDPARFCRIPSGLPEYAPEATTANSFGPLDCRPEESLDDFGADKRMDRLVSLIDIAADTPRRRNELQSPTKASSHAASAPETPNVGTGARTGSGSPQEERRDWQTAPAIDTVNISGTQPKSQENRTSGVGSSTEGDQDSDWSNEVLLKHAAGDRLELYTELANIPLESSTPESGNGTEGDYFEASDAMEDEIVDGDTDDPHGHVIPVAWDLAHNSTPLTPLHEKRRLVCRGDDADSRLSDSTLSKSA